MSPLLVPGTFAISALTCLLSGFRLRDKGDHGGFIQLAVVAACFAGLSVWLVPIYLQP
jgi:hypothetical protein